MALVKITASPIAEVRYPSGGSKTVNASTYLDYTISCPTVDGKTPVGIISCYMSKPGSCSVIDTYLDGTTVHIWILNRTSSAQSVNVTAGILYLAS